MTIQSNIVAIVLAAGSSKRFGMQDKLLAKIDGTSVIERALTAIVAAKIEQRIVVTPPESSVLRELAKRHGYQVAVNDAEMGIGASIAKGVEASQSAKASGIAIFLGDMPFILPATIALLASQFTRSTETKIIRPIWGKQPGHPVLFPAGLRPSLLQLHDDHGAASVIRANQQALELVPIDDPGVVRDIDVVGDLRS